MPVPMDESRSKLRYVQSPVGSFEPSLSPVDISDEKPV